MLNALGRLLSAKFFDHPVLVVGTGRSGTSILLQALGKHPQIYSLHGETPFLTSIGSFAYLFEHGEDHTYHQESIKVDRDYLFDQLRRLAFEISAGPHYGVKRMTKGLLGFAETPLRRRLWSAKSFPGEHAIQGLMVLYPRLRIVYIVRNGCDVVQSMTKFKGFAHQDFERHCLRWAKGVDKYRYLTALPQSCQVTQESLLADPESFFEVVFSHLGLPNHPGAAEFTATTLLHPLDEATRTGTDPRRALAEREPPYAHWTEEQRSVFKEACARQMTELGYQIPF